MRFVRENHGHDQTRCFWLSLFFEKLYKISESDIDVVDAIADQKQVDTHSHSMAVFVKLTHLLEIVDTGEIKKL